MPEFHQEMQMNFLDNILGGGGQQQQDIQNFMQRFEHGRLRKDTPIRNRLTNTVR